MYGETNPFAFPSVDCLAKLLCFSAATVSYLHGKDAWSREAGLDIAARVENKHDAGADGLLVIGPLGPFARIVTILAVAMARGGMG